MCDKYEVHIADHEKELKATEKEKSKSARNDEIKENSAKDDNVARIV